MRDLGLLGLVLVSLAAGWIAARLLRNGMGLFDGLVVGALGLGFGAVLADLLDVRLTGALGALAAATVGATLLAAVLTLARRRR